MILHTSKSAKDKGQAAIGKFFLRIGQVKASEPWRDEWTIPLFQLPLIMDAEGTLSDDARHLATDAQPS